MEMIKNILIQGTAGRRMALDIFFEKREGHRPVVIYAHGFNGFKDWGNFDLIARKFAGEGYVLVKFNFSHNGTIPESPEEFTDLEAFGNNNYSKQLEDLRRVTDWVSEPLNPYRSVIDRARICLIGHSMGGGISILYAGEDDRIKKLITWAGISECKTPWGDWPADRLQQWKVEGVQYYNNTRTGQQMPLYYQLYEDYMQNEERLDIKNAVKNLTIPVLICHGSSDSAVPVASALELIRCQPSARLFIVESDHVFGRKHPWTSLALPAAMEAVVRATLDFLKEPG